MEEKKLDIHNHILPKNWPDLKERFLSLFKNVQKKLTKKLMTGTDMEAGSAWTTVVVDAHNLATPI